MIILFSCLFDSSSKRVKKQDLFTENSFLKDVIKKDMGKDFESG